MIGRRLSAAIAVMGVTVTAGAAPPRSRDADWPCEQIKVSELSLAAVWTGPELGQQQTSWQQDQPVADLVRETAQRRLPLERAKDRIRAFAAQGGEERQPRLLALMAGLFSVLDGERSSVIAGLGRFGARQKELAAQLRADNEKLRALQTDPKSDAGELNQMLQRVTWEAQVFQDRRQALRYACEVPGKIEQRLFGLAQTIQAALP